MEPNRISSLVSGILQGRTELFSELVGEFQKPIYNLALRMTGSPDDAADLTQEIFVRAWINLGRYDPQRKFFTWLYTLALNLIRNHLKKSSRPFSHGAHPFYDLSLSSEEIDPAVVLARKEEKGRIELLLLRLPANQREALLLRFFSELPYDEIAAILGISQSGVKMRVSRGLARLRVLLEEEG